MVEQFSYDSHISHWCYYHRSVSITLDEELPSKLWYNRTLVGNKTVDHSDVVGALPVVAAPAAA